MWSVFLQEMRQTYDKAWDTQKNDYEALMCTNRYCDNVSAPISLIEEKLIEKLKTWLEEYRLKIENDETPENTPLKARYKNLSKMRTELTKIEKQIEKTYDLLEQEIYSTDVFISRSKNLSNKKEELLRNITQIEGEISTLESTPKIDLEYTSGILDAYLDIELVKEKNQLLKSILEHVEYEKDTPNARGKINNANFKLYIYPRVPTK